MRTIEMWTTPSGQARMEFVEYNDSRTKRRTQHTLHAFEGLPYVKWLQEWSASGKVPVDALALTT